MLSGCQAPPHIVVRTECHLSLLPQWIGASETRVRAEALFLQRGTLLTVGVVAATAANSLCELLVLDLNTQIHGHSK